MSIPFEFGATASGDDADHPFVKFPDYVAKLMAENQPDIYRRVIQEVDRHLLREIMKHCRGNQLQAAERLGISRMTLRSKLRSLGMMPNRNHSDQPGNNPNTGDQSLSEQAPQ